jgi:hypothetical protein
MWDEAADDALYEAIYEKFPWIEDIEDALKVRVGDADKMLRFVIKAAHTQGCEDGKRSTGEYIDYLESKIEVLNKLTGNILIPLTTNQPESPNQ